MEVYCKLDTLLSLYHYILLVVHIANYDCYYTIISRISCHNYSVKQLQNVMSIAVIHIRSSSCPIYTHLYIGNDYFLLFVT